MSTPDASNPLTTFDLAALRERRSAKWREHDADVLPVWVAEMDTPLAPPIVEAVTAAVARGDTGYATPDVLPEAFAAFAARRYGWQVDPGRCLLVADVRAGLTEALDVITEPGDAVVLSTPAYPPFFAILARLGRRVVESPLAYTADGYRLDLDQLERDFAAGPAGYLMCNPHNPTGLVFDRAELAAVAELADRYGVRIVADEIHAPLVYPGATHVPLASMDVPGVDRVVTVVSASKAWNLAGLKAALVVAGPGSWPEMARIPEDVRYDAGLLGVIASVAAFEHGEPWLAELLAGLDSNRRLLGELLADRLPEIGYRPPAATYLAWLDCRRLPFGDDPAAALCTGGRVALTGGLPFGAVGAGFARFNFAAPPEVVTEAVDRMAKAVNTAG